ncbi:MAG: WYL domain-containing protein [Epsilonproteobacteria bacterium]|nr:WYL domain-containing protein [Campylobacterota bacterium]
MSQKSSLYRTIEILNSLNSGKRVCISNLAMAYGVSDRTIRRDFELIREIFGDFMHKNKECYRAYQKVLLQNVLSATDLMTLANIINLFGIASMQSSISKDTNDLVKKSMSVYDFKTRPFENIQNKEVIKELEHAIKFHKEINIEYKVSGGSIYKLFHPYKILFLNENFYLVGENISINQFEFLRVSMILKVSKSTKVFYPHRDIVDFIKTIQTPWAKFNQETILVKLRIAKKISKYFWLKKYLPSQEIVDSFENGDIEVHYTISHPREISELIIKWLPNVEILSPRNVHQMVTKMLHLKLNGLSGNR